MKTITADYAPSAIHNLFKDLSSLEKQYAHVFVEHVMYHGCEPPVQKAFRDGEAMLLTLRVLPLP